MMNKNIHKAGIIVAISIPLFILPARISEGQLNDPVNLIGSETVIFLMSLTCWYVINFIQRVKGGWLGLALSLLACCILSNVFYFTFNPIFKDFPFRTAQNPLGIKILMLSSRGILMSVILIPAAYYLKRDGEARRQRLENERLAVEKVKIENKLLEEAVVERTRALHETLSSLEKSQSDLEHQLYIQSRVVASITHDIGGPFKYLIVVSEAIGQLLAAEKYETVAQYSSELHKSLETMFGFVNNLLEFTKLPVQQKLAKMEDVNLAELILQKSTLFEGSIRNKCNEIHVDADPAIHVSSNSTLLGIVVHNLIDNANKHTSKGEINIKTFVTNGVVQMIFENTGKLVPDRVINWVNLHSDRAISDSTSPENSGIGLILVKEITSLLSIKLYMETDEATTRVHLTFEGEPK